MARTLRTTGLAGWLALAAGLYPHVGHVSAAPPQAAQTAAAIPSPQPRGAAPALAAPSRELLDTYCVPCHNERSKARYANLALDRIDVANAGIHAEVLEKVVRQLHMGQMPPEGRPRPDRAALDVFVASLEAALDRAAAASPDPGRVASRRLNRAGPTASAPFPGSC